MTENTEAPAPGVVDVTVTEDPETGVVTAQDFLAEQAKEYGTFVATKKINVNGARAFNPGDPVPNGHVDRGVVPKGAVAKRGTKAANAVLHTSTEKG